MDPKKRVMVLKEFKFHHGFRVRCSEVDAQGIVFNAHYLTYFDTALTEFFRAIDYNYQVHVEDTGNDFHVVKSLIEYKQPIPFDMEIDVHVGVAKLGRSSITFALQIHPKGEENLLCEGEIVWVNAERETKKSAPINDKLRMKLQQHSFV